MLTAPIRELLQGFVNDPPDSPFQDGYLACAIVVATDIFGIPKTDPLVLAAEQAMTEKGAQEQIDAAKLKRADFKVIPGGKSPADQQ